MPNTNTHMLRNLFFGAIFTMFTAMLGWNFTRLIDHTQQIAQLQIHINTMQDIPRRLTVLETTTPTMQQQKEIYDLLYDIRQQLALVQQQQRQMLQDPKRKD